MYTSKRETNPDAEYWQSRYEEQREAQERQQEQEARERKERHEEAKHTARSWPEAFEKQRRLYEEELRECRRDAVQFPDEEDIKSMIAGWERDLERLAQARALWARVEGEIAAFAAAKREEVAAAVEDEVGGLADALRADDPSGWLNW